MDLSLLQAVEREKVLEVLQRDKVLRCLDEDRIRYVIKTVNLWRGSTSLDLSIDEKYDFDKSDCNSGNGL